jgi:hypothetical protein
MPSPEPANETERLAALHALDIVGSAPETAYDEITELAAQICGCPVAYISFIDDDRRWLKARYGLPAEVTDAPRASAVSTTTICGTELLVIPDLKQDPRFENSPMVALEPPCRFYCGMPLITDEGYALGTLCVMDFEPRQLSFEQTESLRRLSHQVLSQLELRRKLIEYGQTIRELDQARVEAASERARAEELLRNVLPAPIAEELKRSGQGAAQIHAVGNHSICGYPGFYAAGRTDRTGAAGQSARRVFFSSGRNRRTIWSGEGQDHGRRLYGGCRRAIAGPATLDRCLPGGARNADAARSVARTM